MEIRRVGEVVWEIPRSGAMRVPARIYASEAQMGALRADPAPVQLAQVAELPGIVGHAMAMPDVHWGYGFPIGGVAAVDADDGVITPGGIGFDINCGVRLLRTRLEVAAVEAVRDRLADRLFAAVPAGVGSSGAVPALSARDERRVLERGAAWAVEEGLGRASDLGHCEDGGRLGGADPDAVSETARTRGRSQVGTLGSGNHFLEVQRVDRIDDAQAAAALGIEEGQVAVMIHAGSRGLGYQVCDDALRVMDRAMRRHGISMPDRQLACVPLRSEEGATYLGAMAAAANFAWANRQVMTGLVERAFLEVLGTGPAALGFGLVYDVCHNVAKMESIVRRACRASRPSPGATRAFGPATRRCRSRCAISASR